MKKTVSLLFAMSLLTLPVASSSAARPGSVTIAEIVVASATADEPEFTVLLDALDYTGLVPVFVGRQPYTVFAPTDAAFAALLEKLEIESIRDLSPDVVTAVLLYHVTRGVRLSRSVVGHKEIAMLDGNFATVDGATIDGASLLVPLVDIRASNGVIHVIDAVLLPPL